MNYPSKFHLRSSATTCKLLISYAAPCPASGHVAHPSSIDCIITIFDKDVKLKNPVSDSVAPMPDVIICQKENPGHSRQDGAAQNAQL